MGLVFVWVCLLTRLFACVIALLLLDVSVGVYVRSIVDEGWVFGEEGVDGKGGKGEGKHKGQGEKERRE